jgi:hypothetical protein
VTVYGTEPAPIEVTARHSNWGHENVSLIISQLRFHKVPFEKIHQFDQEVVRIRDDLGKGSGQIEPITRAAESIGVKVHWIN